MDTFSVLDWVQCVCPFCGESHQEIVYAFLPQQLVLAVVRKAYVDLSLRRVLVVAVAILAQHWHKLLSASVLLQASHLEGFV